MGDSIIEKRKYESKIKAEIENNKVYRFSCNCLKKISLETDMDKVENTLVKYNEKLVVRLNEFFDFFIPFKLNCSKTDNYILWLKIIVAIMIAKKIIKTIFIIKQNMNMMRSVGVGFTRSQIEMLNE